MLFAVLVDTLDQEAKLFILQKISQFLLLLNWKELCAQKEDPAAKCKTSLIYWWQMFDIESVEESKTERDRERTETDIIIIYMHNIVIVRVLWTQSEVKLWYAKSTTKKIGYLTNKLFFSKSNSRHGNNVLSSWY